MRTSKLLGIYLRDHHAGSAAGLELARRCQRKNHGSPLGDCLQKLVAEIEKDQLELERVMEALGLGKSFFKDSGLWAFEKLRRAKPNGKLFGYSPLARLDELEALSLGIEGKRLLWVELGKLARSVSRLQAFQFDSLAARALQQRQTLESFRLYAALDAFLEEDELAQGAPDAEETARSVDAEETARSVDAEPTVSA